MRVALVLEAIDKASAVVERVGRTITAAGKAGVNAVKGMTPPAAIATAFNRAQDAVERFGRSVMSAGRAGVGAFKNMASAANLDAALGRAEQRAAALRGNLMDAAASAYLFAKPIQSAMDFEFAMAGVAKVIDPTAEELAMLSKQAMELSTKVPIAAEGIAKIMEFGGRLQLPKNELAGFATEAATMGFAWDMSAEAAGETMGKLMSVFGRNVEGAVSLGDAVNYLSNNMNALPSSIANVLTRSGAAGSALGLTAEQVAALSATLLSLGVPAEVAGTGMNALFSKLGTIDKQGKPFKAALKAMGLNAKTFAKDVAKDPQAAITNLLKRLEKAGPKAQGYLIDMFGAEYADDVMRLVKAQNEYARALDLVSDKSRFGGSMTKEAEALLKTSKVQYQLAMNAINNEMTVLGAMLLPTVGAVLEQINHIVSAVSAWANANPELASTIVHVVGGFIAMRIAIAGLAWAFSMPVGPATKLFSLFFKYNEAGKNVAVFGRLVGALAAPFKLAGTAALSFFGGLAKGIGAGIAAAGGWGPALKLVMFRLAALRLNATLAFAVMSSRLAGLARALPGATVAALGTALRALSSGFMIAARGAMMLGAALLTTPIGWIVMGLAAVAAAAYLIYDNWATIGPMLSAAWDTVVAVASELWTRFTKALSDGWQAVVAWFTALEWPSLPNIAAGARDLWANVKTWISTGWTSVANWFGSIQWPSLPDIAAGAGDLWANVKTWISTGWNSVKSWFGSIQWPSLPTISATLFAPFAPVITALTNGWNGVKSWFGSIQWPSLPDPFAAIKGALEPIGAWIKEWGTTISTAFGDAVGTIGTAIGNLSTKISEFVAPITNTLKSIGSFVFGPSAADVTATTQQAAAAKAAIEAIPPAATAAVSAAGATLSAANFHSHGVRMMETLAAGIRAGAGSAVAAVRSTVGEIRAHLPHSPAKVGPLSDLDRVQFGQTLAGAIMAGRPAAIGAVAAIAGGMAGAIPGAIAAPGIAAPGLPVPGVSAPGPSAPAGGVGAGWSTAPGGGAGGGGPVSVSISMPVTVSGGASGGDIVNEIRAALPQLAHEIERVVASVLADRSRTEH